MVASSRVLVSARFALCAVRLAGVLLVVASALAVAGCRGGSDPEAVVRAWNDAVYRDDDEAAAAFFAPGAKVVSGQLVFPVPNRETAVARSFAIPCRARIVALAARGETVAATFRIEQRAGLCAGVGRVEGSLFTVRGGKIAVWEILGAPEAVVEDWAEAIRLGQNERAGHYFASGALIVEHGTQRVLDDPEDATRFAAARACGADVLRLRGTPQRLVATFRLRDRKGSSCPDAGRFETDVLSFEVGRIRRWRHIWP
jgi:ketosteroid isomerase-like protein